LLSGSVTLGRDLLASTVFLILPTFILPITKYLQKIHGAGE